MTAFSLYWSDWQCSAAVERGQEGAPLLRLWGGWNQLTSGINKVSAGDKVLVLTYSQSLIYLLGDLEVQEAQDTSDWLREHPDERKSAPHTWGRILVGSSKTPFRLDRLLPGSWLSSWRFINHDGRARLVKHIEKGRLTKPTSFQGCYKITDETMARAEALLAGKLIPEVEALLSKDKTLSILERRLARAPEDVDTARVYADALMEQGDPRGELLALELSPEAPAKMVRKVNALMKAHGEVMIGRPGGFPFRLSWGPRIKPRR